MSIPPPYFSGQYSLNLIISLIQVIAASFVLASNGHPHNTNESLVSFVDFTSKQFESNANFFTTISVIVKDLWSESYFEFSKKLKVFLFKIPRPGRIGAVLMPNLRPKSALLIHKSSSLILHSSYCWNLCDTYLDSNLAGNVIIGCLYIHSLSGTSTFPPPWPLVHGWVLQAFFSLIGTLEHL